MGFVLSGMSKSKTPIYMILVDCQTACCFKHETLLAKNEIFWFPNISN